MDCKNDGDKKSKPKPVVNKPKGGSGGAKDKDNRINLQFYESFDGGWNYPRYSTWNLLRQGSACTACHVTHWTGTIPTNSEIDSHLVDYYRSKDILAGTIHSYVFFAASGLGNAAIQSQNTYSRYITDPELEVIQETGSLRGGKPGDTYFSTQKYNSGAAAQNALALEKTPTLRVDFTIVNDPVVSGPRTVAPLYGQPGLGIEHWSPEEVFVLISKIVRLP